MAEPVEKKRKTGSQTFRAVYTEKWPCLIKSKLGPTYACCTVCSSDFSIGHSGMFDCRVHVNGPKHKKLAESGKQASIASMFKSVAAAKESTHSDNVVKAEARMVTFIARHNLSLAVADDLPSLMKETDPNSTIIKDMKCGRSKTTAMIKEIGGMAKENLVDRMRCGPFSISTDGSNDMERVKLFPLVVRTVSDSGVDSELFSLPVCEGSGTGEKIFQLIDKEFVKNDIPWTNCIALGCDNASVMTGQHKGVISFCRDKHTNIFLSGCPLHLVHIAAEKGADTLPVNFSDLLVDIYYYFHKSSVRAHKLSIHQEFSDKEQLKVLKHVNTRWLSISKCLTRLLHNWDPLKSFFSEEVKQTLSPYAKEKAEKILKLLRSRSTKLYCMFLNYTVALFHTFLINNQSDAPLAAVMNSQCHKLVRTIMIRFVKATAFSGNKPVTEVQYTLPYNVKEDKDLVIGEACQTYIKDMDRNGLTKSKLQEFYKNIKVYFTTICDYLLKKLPLSEPVLTNLALVDPNNILSATESQIRYFATMFPVLVPPHASIDSLIEGLMELQISQVENSETERADSFWIKMKKFKDPSTGTLPFEKISSFMLGLLTIPHSSAHCERIFSSVRKIKTDQRHSLKEDTLEALLLIKTRKDELSFPPATLRRLKSAYTKALSLSQ